MKKVAVMSLLTISAAFMATSEALPQDHPRVEYKATADANITCVLNETCFLPCPYQGQVEKVSWIRVDKPFVPIAVYPKEEPWRLRVDYINISSLSLQQPGGGAILKLNGVQKKHQDMYRCSVTSSTEDIIRFVYLTVHTPVTNVSLYQEGQRLFCRAEGIFPEPVLVWTPGSGVPHINVTEGQDGLFTVWSAISFSPRASKEITCNVSTAYSWRAETIRPQCDAASDNHSLQYLWILLLGFVIPVASILVYCYRHKLPQVKGLCKKNTPTSHDDGPDSSDPLTSVEKTSDRLPPESFHLNGLNEETSM